MYLAFEARWTAGTLRFLADRHSILLPHYEMKRAKGAAI
jgi:hypothetical protein